MRHCERSRHALCSPTGCWVGSADHCKQGSTNTTGWISRARPTASPTPKACTSDFCKPNFDDSSWRSLDAARRTAQEPLKPEECDAYRELQGKLAWVGNTRVDVAVDVS